MMYDVFTPNYHGGHSRKTRTPLTARDVPVDDIIPNLAYINNPGLGVIAVYQVTDTEWYAGADAESCRAKFLADSAEGNSGVAADYAKEALEEFGPALEVNGAGMARLRFHSDEKGKISFREALDDLIVSGSEFPIFFASSEY
jgi:hypothetical protein